MIATLPSHTGLVDDPPGAFCIHRLCRSMEMFTWTRNLCDFDVVGSSFQMSVVNSKCFFYIYMLIFIYAYFYCAAH